MRNSCKVLRHVFWNVHICRTLAPVGAKQVHRVVQSMSSLTHSYTVVPVLYADGRLGEKLFVILPEAGGSFPRRGHWSATNLLVVPGTTHMMRKDQVPLLIEECVMATSPPYTIVLLDSWSGFKDHSNVLSGVPPNKQMRIMTIPPGATALCQPLDVYFFRLFKRFIRKIHENALHLKPDFNCFARDNTLKVTTASVFYETYAYC